MALTSGHLTSTLSLWNVLSDIYCWALLGRQGLKQALRSHKQLCYEASLGVGLVGQRCPLSPGHVLGGVDTDLHLSFLIFHPGPTHSFHTGHLMPASLNGAWKATRDQGWASSLPREFWNVPKPLEILVNLGSSREDPEGPTFGCRPLSQDRGRPHRAGWDAPSGGRRAFTERGFRGVSWPLSHQGGHSERRMTRRLTS